MPSADPLSAGAAGALILRPVDAILRCLNVDYQFQRVLTLSSLSYLIEGRMTPQAEESANVARLGARMANMMMAQHSFNGVYVMRRG